MATGEASIHIDRPPDEVFAFVADPANNPLWRKNVIRTEWLDDGPMRVGRRGRQTARLLGRPWTVEAEVIEWDPPRSATWRTVQGPVSVRSWVRVEPDGAGSARQGRRGRGLHRADRRSDDPPRDAADDQAGVSGSRNAPRPTRVGVGRLTLPDPFTGRTNPERRSSGEHIAGSMLRAVHRMHSVVRGSARNPLPVRRMNSHRQSGGPSLPRPADVFIR